MLDKPLSAITKTDLELLIENGYDERYAIDYKKDQVFPKGEEDLKGEFRKDVTSFANTRGGDLVIGVRDEKGVPKEICPIRRNREGFKLQMHGILRSRINPRLSGVEIEPIPIDSDGDVYIIRIPRSYNRPHQVEIGDSDFQFWQRNSGGKERINLDQLRNLILGREALSQHIRDFRRDRWQVASEAYIVDSRIPIGLSHRARLVFHIVPWSAFEPGSLLPVTSFTDQAVALNLAPRFTLNYEHRYNLDGVLFYPLRQSDSLVRKYHQVFRNGIVEVVDAATLSESEEDFSSVGLERLLYDTLQHVVMAYQRLGITGPLSLLLTFVGHNRDAKMDCRPALTRSEYALDRDPLLIPDSVVEDLSKPVDEMLAPIFDAVWNAVGEPFCRHIDADGKWSSELIPPERRRKLG